MGGDLGGGGAAPATGLLVAKNLGKIFKYNGAGEA